MKLRISALRRRNPALVDKLKPWTIGEIAEIPVEVWETLKEDRRTIAGLPFEEWPTWAQAVAMFKKPQDTGIGDTIHRTLGTAGKLFSATLDALGVPCHCPERRAEFNDRFHY